ncbi:CD1375 family protein [Clostridium tertium]
MQKIFINKETNMVEQILKVETKDELQDEYFDNCYAVLDKEEKINAYNLKYNKESNLFEEVEGIPAFAEVEIKEKNNDIEKLKKENEELKEINNIQDEAINVNLLATDEIYSMLEPILSMTAEISTLEVEGVSRMVDLYVVMIQRGLKTIDQVPARYREEVKIILTEIEK